MTFTASLTAEWSAQNTCGVTFPSLPTDLPLEGTGKIYGYIFCLPVLSTGGQKFL